MTLPYDIARCAGAQYDGDWREGCDDCLRRTSPAGPMSPSIEAPALVVFECEYRIGPRDVPERCIERLAVGKSGSNAGLGRWLRNEETYER